MNILGIVIFLIYAYLYIKYPSFRNRRMRYSKRMLQSYDEIISENSLEEQFNGNAAKLQAMRDSYEIKVEQWLKSNTPKLNLVNKYCELTLYRTEKFEDKPDDLCFYCKEHSLINNKPGRLFYVKGDNAHVSTMWTIINMDFDENCTYDKINRLYRQLNFGVGVVGSMRYFHENIRRYYPEFVTNKWAMNESCKMEIQISSDGEKVIYCYNIWNRDNFFYIKANTLVLYAILAEFSKNKNKFETINQLYYKYSARKNCTVKNSLTQEIQNTKSEQKQTGENITPEVSIEKFDERNIDL